MQFTFLQIIIRKLLIIVNNILKQQTASVHFTTCLTINCFFFSSFCTIYINKYNKKQNTAQYFNYVCQAVLQNSTDMLSLVSMY